MYRRKQGRRRERASHERNIKLITLCSLLQLHGRWHSGSTPAHSRTVLFFSRLSGVEQVTNTVKHFKVCGGAPCVCGGACVAARVWRRPANLATAHDWRETGGDLRHLPLGQHNVVNVLARSKLRVHDQRCTASRSSPSHQVTACQTTSCKHH